MAGGRPPIDEKDRLKSKVNIAVNGCHEWTAGIDRGGYGNFYFRGTLGKAHRASYILFVGEIPDGKWVLHKCDNRKCVNPEHLFLGGAKENTADMDAKGRRGTKAKLTYDQVAEVKRLLLDRTNTQQKIAAMFGIDQTSVSRILRGQTTLFRK